MAVQSANPPTSGSPASVPPVNGGVKSFFKPFLPSLPKISSFKTFFSPTRLLLLFTVVILLLTILFFLDFKDFRSIIFKTVPKTPVFAIPVNTQDIKFPSGVAQDRFQKNFQEATQTEDLAKRYTYLENNFLALLGFYIRSHDPALRAQAEKYSAYMAKNYPTQYEKNKKLYTVECMDTECGKANYPKEIEDLKTELNGISSLNKDVLEDILKKFEAAAISQNQDSQWSGYFGSFLDLKNEYTRTKDIKIKDAGEELKTFLKQNYPKNFSVIEKLTPEALVFK